MKLTVLLDNNTLIDEHYLIGESGVSYLIEDGDMKILFDTGYSDAYIRNAFAMGEELLDLDYIVWSHGHLDHTWGMHEYIKKYTQAETFGREFNRPTLFAHPMAFMHKRVDEEGDKVAEIGPLLGKKQLAKHFAIQEKSESHWFSDKLVWLGQIERTNDFENKKPLGLVETPDGEEIGDFLMEDSAFAYKSEKGLFIISACSHPGICNIIEHAKKVTGVDKVYDVIGGFHLQKPEERVLDGTVEYFKNLNAENLHACHCTDLQSKIALAKVANLQEVGVGMIFELE